jgi:hypothetical protein
MKGSNLRIKVKLNLEAFSNGSGLNKILIYSTKHDVRRISIVLNEADLTKTHF